MHTDSFARKKRFSFDKLVHRLFGANAFVAFFALGLITLFLFREGAGFFRQNLDNLRIYRSAGLEAADLAQNQIDLHTTLKRVLFQIRLNLQQTLQSEGIPPEEIEVRLRPLEIYILAFEQAVEPLQEITSELRELAVACKEKALTQSVDPTAEVAVIKQMLPTAVAASDQMSQSLMQLRNLATLEGLPKSLLPQAARFSKQLDAYLVNLPESNRALKSWDPSKPVPWWQPATSFLFGKRWVTNSFWHDAYGVIPLLTGSLLVTATAMSIAVPVGITAALYVSEMASPGERRFIKPCIEFIASIPSVVFGFVGIMILGETVRTVSQLKVLDWVPGFPIAERLNAFTAGCLLALMALPTIFTLTEDALQRIPKEYKEASLALGSTKLQWITRILMPAALPGIASAVLLGFGRVIGETMVVLLCAGNRISIPEFSPGALFEPVHTMTGIIAQEMGEVVQGSTHYRALFVVGLLLFSISLIINWIAQLVVRRFKTGFR